MHKRSKFMQFFERPDDQSGGGDDIYGSPEVNDDDVSPEIRAAMGEDVSENIFTESGSELHEDQEDGSQSNTQQESTTDSSGEDGTTDPAQSGTSESTEDKPDVTQVLESLVDKLASRTQESPQPQGMTPEQQEAAKAQIREFTKPVTVTKETLEAMGFEDPTDQQIQAFQNLQSATVTNAVRVAQIAMEQSMEPLRGQVEVLGHHVSNQQEQTAVETFYTQNEDLKPHSKLVDMVSKQVASDTAWLQGKNFDDVAKRVAVDTKALLTELGVEQTGQTQGNTSANRSADQQQRKAPAMQTLGGSGRSSGRGSGGGNQSENPDADIYT